MVRICDFTELMIGRIQDTNSFWLAQQASELGATMARITIIGDDRATIVAALRSAVVGGAALLAIVLPAFVLAEWFARRRSGPA